MKQMMLWLGLMLSLSGCGWFSRDPAINSNQYFCPPKLAYTEDGSVDDQHYRVNRECFKSSNAKLKACYIEVR